MGKKALARLQPDAIARVPKLKCRCRPHRNCLASLDLEEVRKCRQEYWRNLATERERMSWLERARRQARVLVLCSAQRNREERQVGTSTARLFVPRRGSSFTASLSASLQRRVKRPSRARQSPSERGSPESHNVGLDSLSNERNCKRG